MSQILRSVFSSPKRAKRAKPRLLTALMLLYFIGLVAGVGCTPEKPSAARLLGPGQAHDGEKNRAEIDKAAVARVNQRTITLAEFNERLSQLPEFARVRYTTLAQKKEWLESLVQFEILADIAQKKGFAHRPQVYFSLKEALAEQLLADILREEASPAAITRADIEAYYRAHEAQFRSPAARRVALIEIPTREEAARIRQRVEDEMERAEDNPIYAFRRAAAAYSADPAAMTSGGDLGFIPRVDESLHAEDDSLTAENAPQNTRRDTIARAVAALDAPGELSPVFGLGPVEDAAGWGIAIFMEERDEKIVTLDDATPDIRRHLQAQRREQAASAFIAKLKKDSSIEKLVDEEQLAKDIAQRLQGDAAPREVANIRLRAWPVFAADTDPQP